MVAFETLSPMPLGRRMMDVDGSVAGASVRTVKIPIPCEADGKVHNKTFTIQNVSYAPGLPLNIISCRALTLMLMKDGRR